MVLSDYHPLRKCINADDKDFNYFYKELQAGDVAYKNLLKMNNKTFPMLRARNNLNTFMLSYSNGEKAIKIYKGW